MKYIIYGLIAYLIISFFLLLTKNSDPKDSNYETIIVLGNSPNPRNVPNLFLQQRLDTGIELFKKGKADKLILTGTLKESDLSEAEIMQSYCLKRGISKRSILLETKAKSTKENLIYSHQLMSGKNLRNGLVITSPHHINRTKKYCTLLGMDNFEVISCRDNIWTFLTRIPLTIIEEIKIHKMSEKKSD